MYNLFVTALDDAWLERRQDFQLSRCLREYTSDALMERYGDFDARSVAELKTLPCIFAYEGTRHAPAFGRLTDIVSRLGIVRFDFEIQPVEPFLSAADMAELRFELDIDKWELNRTHWALKDVDLARGLHARGIILPAWAGGAFKGVDVSKHTFDVALSFPGEARPYVEQVAHHLEHLIGPNAYFYDANFVAQLARPGLDALLQDIYGNRSKLIVVFVGADYQRKDWCGIEFRAIREVINSRRANHRVMLVRMDDGEVQGIFGGDGYVDARRFTAAQIAGFIQERVALA